MDINSNLNNRMCDISIIIPVFNEIEGLDKCLNAVLEILDKSFFSYEIIFVDDGSDDGSLEKMLSFISKHKTIYVIPLNGHFGQQKALLAGLKQSKGKVVITYDSDLQFHPQCLIQLAQKVMDGYDIASGIRQNRQDSLLYNQIPSKIGQYLLNKTLNIKQKDFGSVKAYSRQLVEKIILHSHDYLIIPALAYYLNKNFIEIPVVHQKRIYGYSKWSLFKRIKMYFDIYTVYAIYPFIWLMIIGVVICLFSLLLLIFVCFNWYWLNYNINNEIILFLSIITLLGGLNLFALSLIGEFVSRNFRINLNKQHRNSKTHNASTEKTF